MDEAVQALERALDLEPINASAGRELAAVSMKPWANFPNAESTLKKGLALRPGDWTSLYDLSMFYYRQGRYTEAVPLLQRVTDLAPDNNSGYTALGAVFWMQGQYENAANHSGNRSDLRPTASAYTSLGTIYFFMGRCSRCSESKCRKPCNCFPSGISFGATWAMRTPVSLEKRVTRRQLIARHRFRASGYRWSIPRSRCFEPRGSLSCPAGQINRKPSRRSKKLA